MNRLNSALSVFTGTAAMLLAAVAGADVLSRPDNVQVTQDDWAFVPVVHITDGSSVEVAGVLALRDKSLAVGNNLVAVWYENPHQPNTEWPAKTWDSESHWAAIEWVKASHEIGDEWDFMWPTIEPSPSEPTSIDPVDYDKGVISGDPFADYVGSPTYDQIVEVLVDAGYKAASIPVDKDGPCEAKTVLPALEDVTTLNVLFGELTEEDIQGAFAALVPQGCGAIVAAGWKPTAPTGFIPAPVPPAGTPPLPQFRPPGAPRQTPINPPIPGLWSLYTCKQTPVGCTCTAYGQGTAPGIPGVIWIRDVCTAPVCPSNPANPPGCTNCGMTCVPNYYY